MIRAFAEKEVKPLAAEVDEEERFPVETVEKMAKLGRRVAELLTREKLPFRKKIGSPAQMLAPALHKVLPGRAMNRILRQYTLGGK